MNFDYFSGTYTCRCYPLSMPLCFLSNNGSHEGTISDISLFLSRILCSRTAYEIRECIQGKVIFVYDGSVSAIL